jgi:hypothetical protein
VVISFLQTYHQLDQPAPHRFMGYPEMPAAAGGNVMPRNVGPLRPAGGTMFPNGTGSSAGFYPHQPALKTGDALGKTFPTV